MSGCSARRQRALQQRQCALERAKDLFLARGYAAITVEDIASAVGVSAATVYKSYGGKAGLVRQLCEVALAGSSASHAHDRSDALRDNRDARAVVAGGCPPRGGVAPLLAAAAGAAISRRNRRGRRRAPRRAR